MPGSESKATSDIDKRRAASMSLRAASTPEEDASESHDNGEYDGVSGTEDGRRGLKHGEPGPGGLTVSATCKAKASLTCVVLGKSKEDCEQSWRMNSLACRESMDVSGSSQMSSKWLSMYRGCGEATVSPSLDKVIVRWISSRRRHDMLPGGLTSQLGTPTPS